MDNRESVVSGNAGHKAGARDAAARRSPVLLTLSCAVLVLLLLPAPASGAPAASHELEVRQAHLAWSALDRDVEMQAVITYCGTLYGADTSSLESLRARFRTEEALIQQASSGKDIDLLVLDMRNTTARFRSDTFMLMSARQGDWEKLAREISEAKDNNPYILAKKKAYQAVRTSGQMADFDTWVKEGQQAVDDLAAAGYDTTASQRALDVFASKRPEVLAAISTGSETAILAEDQQIRPLSEIFVRELSQTRSQVAKGTQYRFFIDQADRAVAIADDINVRLVPIMIDIGEVDPLLVKTKRDLMDARNVLGTGNPGLAKAPMTLVQKDLRDLAEAYRGIRRTVSVPDTLAGDLNTLALRLDEAAGQMEESS